MSGLDDVEYASLADQIRRIEKLLDSGGQEGADVLLKSFLHNARSRMDEIKGDDFRSSDEKKDQKTREAASIAQLVEMEHRLNAEEKEQYAGLLEREFFTKSDVNNLNQFYAGAWDKLSDSGKAEISDRLWEGIARGELQFEDISAESKKKEADFLYQRMTGQVEIGKPLRNISEQDQADFKTAYEAKDQKAVEAVLSRENFSLHVSTHAAKEGSLHDPSSSSKIKAEEPNLEVTPEEKLKATAEISLAGISIREAPESPKPPNSGLMASDSIGRG